MINLIVISLQFITVFLLGRTFYNLTNHFLLKNKNNLIFQLRPHNFYLLFGIFFIGNMTVLVNFFTGSDKEYFKFLIIFLIILNLFFVRKPEINFSHLLQSFTIYIFLMISTYNFGLSKDSDVYHLNNQLFIKEESIYFGLSNLHHRYGFSSLWEYILSNFWFGDNLIFLNTPNLIILFSLYFFILNFLKSKNYFFIKVSSLILVFGVLDNFGIGGGRNGFIGIDEIGAFDNSFAILFIICSIFTIFLYVNDKNHLNEYFYLGVMILMLGQIRYLGFIIFIPFLFKLIKEFNFKDYSSILCFGSVLTFIWFIKNIIISSCIIFPVYQTCLTNLNWHQKDQAKVVYLSIIGHPRNPNDIFLPRNNFSWINNWIDVNYSYLINFILSLVVIKLFFYIKPTYKTFKSLLVSIFLFFFWFIFLPDYRFAPPVFLLILLIINYDYLSSSKIVKIRIFQKTISGLIILFLCTFLTVRQDAYIKFYNDPYKSLVIKTQEIEYISRTGYFGVKPVNGKTCFLNRKCFPDDYEVVLEINGLYKVFKPVKIDYWTNFLEDIRLKKSI